MKRQKMHGALSGAALLLAGLALVPSAANAATFAVTNTNDSGAGSLRQAIIDANTAPGADVVDASGVTGVISLASNLQDVVDTVDVNGPGANALTVNSSWSGNGYFFAVTPGATLNVSGLTLSHGTALWNFGKHGIVSFGTVNLTDCALIGGEQGLLTFGSATVANCTVTDGIHGITKYSGTASVINCTFSNNLVAFNNRELGATLTNCTVSGNDIGIHNDPAGNVLVKNTICVGNDIDFRGSGLSFINVAGGNNITTGTAAGAGLDPNGLQDNGGPTKTIAIVGASSPAIDGAGPGAPATDQRGFARSGAADIGAFEYAGTAPNSAPVANNDAASTTAITAVAGNVLTNDDDADGDTLTAALVTSPAHGVVELLADGSFVYTPAVGFTGTDSFTYQANDGTDNSNVATVTITVTQPVTSGGSKVTGGGLIYSDEEGGTASFSLNPQSNTDGSILKGKVSFEDLDADVVVRSTSITGILVEGNQARIFGKATLNGSGSFDFVVDVVDNGEPGGTDTFQIRLSNGYDSGVEVLEGGNIQVHK